MSAVRTKRPSRTLRPGRGSIRGVIRANGGWMFVVQALGIENERTPRYCKLATIEQLSGSVRKKAERWVRYLNAPGEGG